MLISPAGLAGDRNPKPGGNRVERIYRESRIFVIGGGSEEILRDLAGRQIGLEDILAEQLTKLRESDRIY